MSAEAPALQPYRDRLAAADATSTVYSSIFDGGWPDAPHRTLRNSTIEMWEAAGRPSSGERPGEGETIGTWSDGELIVRYGSDSPRLGATGDIEAMSMWAGQSVGLVDDVRTAHPGVIEVRLERAMTRLPGRTRTTTALSPSELFASYLAAENVDDQPVRELFDRLLEEIQPVSDMPLAHGRLF